MTDDNNIYYVYEYLRDDGSVYYVGKGSNYRYREKHTYVNVPGRSNIRFVAKYMTEDDAFDLEEKLTHKYGLMSEGDGILENKVHGGKATHVPTFTGCQHTVEAKRKISDGNKGKVRTAEHKAKYQQPKTKEHAENIRKANLGRVDSDERRESNRKGAMKIEVRAKKRAHMILIAQKKKELGMKHSDRMSGCHLDEIRQQVKTLDLTEIINEIKHSDLLSVNGGN